MSPENPKSVCAVDPVRQKLLDDLGLEIQVVLGRNLNWIGIVQENVRCLTEPWNAHERWKEERRQDKREHWLKAKASPPLWDPDADHSQAGLEWDDHYFYGWPDHEMPARYVPRLLTAIEEDIRVNQERAEREKSQGDERYRGTVQHVDVRVRTLASIRARYEALPDKDRESDAVWISTLPDPLPKEFFGPVLWYRYLGIPERRVFGCWRPLLRPEPLNVEVWFYAPPDESLLAAKATFGLPCLSEREDSSRRYALVAALHDRLPVAKKITADVWPADLLNFLVLRLEQGQHSGLDETFLRTAWNDVRAELGQTCQQVTDEQPRRTSTARNPPAQTGTAELRQDVTNWIGQPERASLARQRADDFCAWVERSIDELREWAQKPIQATYRTVRKRVDDYRVRHSNRLLHARDRQEVLVLRKRLDRVEAKAGLPPAGWGEWSRWQTGVRHREGYPGRGYHPLFVDDEILMEAAMFFAPPDVILPINWLIPGEYNPREPKPYPDDEQILLDFFLLAVVQRKTLTSGETDTILGPSYAGRFNRDAFCDFLWVHCLKSESDEEANGRIRRAWDRVKGLLTGAKGAGDEPNGPGQAGETQGSQRLIIAEVEPLRQTADELRAFAGGKWIGKELSQQDCDRSYHELVSCFHPSFEYCLQWLGQHAHADSADNLKNRQRALYEKARAQYLPSEPNLRILFPDNLRVEILSLAEEIERTVAGVPAPAQSPGDSRYVFKNEGATWRIIYEGHETTVKDSLGMKYICYLMTHPNTLLECQDIERACSKESPESRRRMDSGEAMDADLHANRYDLKQLDDCDKETTEGLLRKLQDDMDDADDPARKAELKKEHDILEVHLRKNLNKHGRPRSVDKPEQARSRVQKAVNAAKKAIAKADAHIGSHFEAVRGEGTAYTYKPSSEFPWILD